MAETPPNLTAGIDPQLLDALAQGALGDPFALLGPHRLNNQRVLRCYLPGALAVEVSDAQGAHRPMQASTVPGLFTCELAEGAYRLRIHWPGGEQETEDPYAFGLLLGELDLHLLCEGRHLELGQCLGAHATRVDGVDGVRFAVWAPNARRVSVVGDFNSWDGRRHPMRKRVNGGVWELFIPRVQASARYKYELLGEHGLLPLKADPVALQAEAVPGTASIVPRRLGHSWQDQAWMAQRGQLQRADAPMSVYEVHAESWQHGEDGRPLGWEALADRLLPYVQQLGFTHIELLPIMSHPFGGSWGYQPLGLFAPQASLGAPDALAGFVDRCHQAGVGVILDWVPAHFPSDAHGLARFDGSALYEHEDPREGFHHDWHTLIYNFGRHEVRSFLLSSALHWLQAYHIDGLRVDAVASMLYRDYSRREGQWIPNRYGGRENLEAVSFLREMNALVGERCPGAITIAEESTAWPGVSRPVDSGGLGFWYKWNMGWMNDTLRYVEKDPVYRQWEHQLLTFGLIYAFSENFVLPLSHDEVVHGKKSLLAKMPGDGWQRFANLRAYYAFMWAHPGKKLLFMGCEIALWQEWNHDQPLDWPALESPLHRGVQHLVGDLNGLYRSLPALHREDCVASGFQWVVGNDHTNSVLAWLRLAEGQPPLLAVCNFTPVPRHGYRVGVPQGGWWKEVLNTDASLYGGSNTGNGGGVSASTQPEHAQPYSLELSLPPLGVVWLVPI